MKPAVATRAGMSLLGDKRAGIEGAISNVIRVLRLHQRVCVSVCMCLRRRLSQGILLFEK